MIEAQGVVKRFAGTDALRGVSLTAQNGAVTGFVGPNGAGKSTLLRAICGLIYPDAGTTSIDGLPLSETAQPGRALGAFLSAEGIPTAWTARSYLQYVCDLQSLPRSKADDALSAVGLEDVAKRKVKTFSLGMRQRLGIAGAIVGEPLNLILDEPINGLDPDGILWLRKYLRDRAAKGCAVLLSSHHMNELALVADQVVMINQGQIVRSGQLDSFVAGDIVRTYFESDDLPLALAVLTAHGMRCEPYGEGGVVSEVDPTDVGRILFTQGPGARHLSRLERTIEQAYFDELDRSHVSQP